MHQFHDVLVAFVGRREINMKKTLPINIEPYIRTYTHHGYFHAITSTDDKVNYDIKKEVASIEVGTINQYKWKVQCDQLEYTISSNNIINFYGNKWNTNMNAAFWRECEAFDKLELVIHEQLYSNAFANIIVFFANNHENTMTDLDSSYEFQVGNYSKDGLFYRIKSEPHKTICLPVEKPIKISLRKEERNIIIECIGENIYTQHLNLPNDISLDRIGFAVNLGCNSYYEWLFSNYINFFVNTADPMPIDFFCDVHKNWYTNTSNYFVDYRVESVNSIKNLGFSIIQFITKMIDLNRYIEVLINDNIHFGTTGEKEPYFHPDLIYGYDDSEEVLYILYINQGKVASTTMKYSDFLSKENYLSNRILYMYEYNPGYELFKLSPKHILQLFKEYKLSQNISFYEPFYENYCVGIEALNILFSDNGMQRLLSDIRISHLLLERSICNKDRIEYLCYKHIIDEVSYIEISAIISEQCEMALTLRNSILKNKMSGRPTPSTIKEHLIKFIAYEHMFVDNIITILSE